jgi:twitching motility protein PilT
LVRVGVNKYFVDKYFRALVKLGGSDLHMKVGKPPIVRVNGTLEGVESGNAGSRGNGRLLFPMMNERTPRYF